MIALFRGYVNRFTAAADNVHPARARYLGRGSRLGSAAGAEGTNRRPHSTGRKPTWLRSNLIQRWRYITILGIAAPIIVYYISRIRTFSPLDGDKVKQNPLLSVFPPEYLDKIKPLTDQELEEHLSLNEWDVFMDEQAQENDKSFTGSIKRAVGLGGGTELLPPTNIISVHANQVKSNAVIEDTYVIAYTRKGVILGIFDGHSGTECSLTLKKYLNHYIAAEIDKIPGELSDEERRIRTTNALKRGFVNMDNDILQGGFEVEDGYSKPSGINSDIHKYLAPALSGSCALVAYIEKGDAYFANTGDSRALIGKKYGESNFHYALATSDHTTENSREYTRILSEHPGEHDAVVRRNRLFGYLQPSRAFGDARFKYPVVTAVKLTLNGITKIPFIDKYITPPYLTAEPDISHFKLDANEDKFIVMFSDGIHDRLENEDVISILKDYYNSHIQSSPRSKSPSESSSSSSSSGPWDTSNPNIATRLIRNSISKGIPDAANYLMAVPAPYSRYLRDDMTVIVAFIGTKEEEDNFKVSSKIIKNDTSEYATCISKPPCKSIKEVFVGFSKEFADQKPNRLKQWMDHK